MQPWPAEQEALLRKLWAEGLSASQIARAIYAQHQTQRSRNGVIGKIHRLGLGRRLISGGRLDTGKIESARKKRASIAFVPNRIIKPTKRETLRAELALIAALEPLGAEIHDATGCRYIAGDPQVDSRVCGRAIDRGAWCALHAKLVYQPSAPKARVVTPEDRERRRWLRQLQAQGMAA
jgi:GcrA cell cycle regulator